MAPSPPSDYIRLIRSKGYRSTPQRQLILDIIRESGEHLTLEQIFQRVQVTAPTLNRATVYRTLHFLCELRVVVAADLGGGHWVYEIAGDTPHHHLVCRTCGKVFQITHTEVKCLIDQVFADHDFLIDMDHMALFGLCPTCRKTIS